MHVCMKEHPCVYKLNVLYIPAIPKQFTKLLKDDPIQSSYFCFIVDIAELQYLGIGICICTQMRNQKEVGATGLQLPLPRAPLHDEKSWIL